MNVAQKELFIAALESLPTPCPLVISYLYYEEKTVEETALALCMTPEQVVRYKRKALCLLQRFFKERGISQRFFIQP